METARVLAATAAIFAFAAASFAVPALALRAARARSAARVHDAALSGDKFAARLLRNGIAPATGVARRLAGDARIRSYFQGLRWLAASRGYETTDVKAGGIVISLAAALLPLGWLLSSSAVFGVMAAACLAAGLGMAANQGRERQREAMREEVPDMLHAMSACFHAGYSLMQTFGHIAREAQGPLRRLFHRAESDLATGRTAAEALRRMREDSELSELAFVTAALEIQHQTGGSLQQIIDSACESVESQLALRRALRVQTAQARLSMRVVTIMPFVLIAVFSLVSPGFLSPFFASPLGIAVFALAMGMQAAGVLAVRRMLDVKEG